MRKSINNVLEKLNLSLGSYKVCEYTRLKKEEFRLA